MVKLVREDIEAALLLSWLKYITVTEKDVEKMNNNPVLTKKEPEIVEKSKRKLLRINKNENPETPEFQISKRMKNSSYGLMNLTKNGSRSFSKNTETHEASGAGNFTPVPKRVRVSPLNLPKKLSGSSSFSKNPSNPNPKRVRVSPSTLMNLPKNSSGSVPKLPPIENLTTLIGQCSNPFMKQLTKSDVDEHQGRLLLNNEDVRKQLLPLLNEESEDIANGIKVKTFDSMGKFYNMRFKAWGNYKSYVLLGSWIQFIKEHGLKIDDYVTVWMFRHNQTGELCFALT